MNRRLASVALSISALFIACSSCSSSAHHGQQPGTQLKASALATSDLPFGWAVSPASTVSSVTAPCSAITADATARLPARAEVDFQQSEDGPFLQEILASGPDPQVRALWSAAQKAASSCSASSSAPASPGSVPDSTRLATTTFSSYGDASYALQLTALRSGVTYGGDVIVIRKGQVYVEVAVFGVGGVPASLVRQLVGTATHKAF